MPKTGDLLGKWTIGRPIRRGGQALVFEATSGDTSIAFAIKPIVTRGSKKGARFKQEVEQHARLTEQRAPNIIPLIDWHIEVREDGATEGYIVMPRAETNLNDAASTFEGRVELSLDVFRGIVRGAEAAHALGIIHRDLKPANILFLEASVREALISDFGICLVKDVQDRLTDVGETVGARFYMAPEQERGGKIDVTPAADVYALGKLLHFMLTGRNIFREELDTAFTPQELAADRRLEIIRDELIARTVVADTHSRMQTSAELGALVDELIARFRGTPSSGSPPTTRPSAPSDPGTMDPVVSNRNPSHALDDTREVYESAVREILRGSAISLAVRFDNGKQHFDRAWNTIRLDLQPTPESLMNGVTTMIDSQREISLTLLAIARFDASSVFGEIPSYLEYILNSTENVAGDRRVRSVAHLAAGFQYVTAAVAGLARHAWDLLTFLLNLKLEWYYQSARPLYSYALDMGYFFHPEALDRKATVTHDLYRTRMTSSMFAPFLGLRNHDLTTPYIQTQFLMCIKAAQLTEQGVPDVDPFAYFGRFYSDRLIPLLERMEHDSLFANGVTRGFSETPDVWFQRLPDRIKYIKDHFYDHARFDWASLDSWPE